ncbi:hypothetical protein ACJIZ3_006403 [Penstemon smallii]|uniref:Uncharacterized protein n=1 Tax=Penstemon smallii TaxID=265156 RepID=A0ABD3S816_9LAMI
MYIDNVQPFLIEKFVYYGFDDPPINWFFGMYLSMAIRIVDAKSLCSVYKYLDEVSN